MILSIALLPSRLIQADPLNNWHWLNPLEGVNPIVGMAFSTNTFVAVGENGTILRSSDGRTWSAANSGTVANLAAAAFGNGTFVVVGDTGTILTSSDGIAWTAQSSGTTNQLDSLAYGGGVFVAGSTDGTNLISSNASVWTPSAFPASAGQNSVQVVFGQGVFVAAVTGDYGYFTLWTSPDGTNWAYSDSATNFLGEIFYANGYFASSLGSALSTNGADWYAQNYPPINSFLAYANGAFVIPSDEFTYSSTSFSAWASKRSNASPGEESVGGYGDGLFVMYGNLTNEAANAPSHFLFSTNALRWVSADSSPRIDLYAVAWYDGTLIAGGAGGLVISTNGTTWTEYSGSGSPNGPYDTIADFAFGNCIEVGADDSDIPGNYTVLSLVWTNQPSTTELTQAPISQLGGYPPVRLAFGDGTFVGVAGYSFANSADGIDWLPSTSGIGNANAVAFGNGLFVAVCLRGAILTSTNGATWQAQDSQTPEDLYGVAYGNGEWLALGDSGTVATSPDGTNWTTTSYGGPDFLISGRLIFANGMFLALVNRSGSGQNVVASSSDGITWTNHVLPASVNMYGMTFANNSLVVVGINGAILRSDPFPVPPILLSGQTILGGSAYQLTASGVGGLSISFQASTNLTDWTCLTNFTATNDSVQFVDALATNYNQRFYRAVEQQCGCQ